MPLSQKIVNFIGEKSRKECGDTVLRRTVVYIQQLRAHINGHNKLSNQEIESKLDSLIAYTTLTMELPVNDLELLRARRCESNNFEHIDKLSYIKDVTASFPAKGRLNRAGEAIFYASLAINNDDSALHVVLSETKAKELDQLNILRSHQKNNEDLSLRVIGIWDEVRKDRKPSYLAENVFSYYREAWALMQTEFNPKLSYAFQLTDRFLADVMAQEGNEKLYDVTSIASYIFLDSDKIDGILYSSVEAKNAPAIALKPCAVNRAIEPQWVADVRVIKHLGYEFYLYHTIKKTNSIDSSGKLNW